jgi:superfamily I DNA/RNA helicase
MIHESVWQPADGLVLEPNALIAVKEKSGSLALTAGPGAGKTEMLAQKADFLLRTGSCRYPKRILAISFKVDAAANLRERVKRRCGSSLASRFDSHTFHAFAKRIIDRFRPVLTGLDALNADYTIGEKRVANVQITFEDLVPLAVQILKSCDIARNVVRQTYAYVFLDEFQDCTKEQYSLIKVLFGRTPIPLTAVGDTKQKIMAWAGALEGIFVTFAQDFKAKPLNLYRNFRSQAQLLRMQNRIIEVMDPAAVMADDLIKGEGGEICVESFEDDQQEAEALAAHIDQWVNGEASSPSEIAVLVPRLPEHYCGALMSELDRLGLPYRNEQQLQDLLVEPLARLVIDYLLVLYGSREPAAYSRLMEQLTGASYERDELDNARHKWTAFLQSEKESVVKSKDRSPASVWENVRKLLAEVGEASLSALSAEYQAKSRLEEIMQQVRSRLEALIETESDAHSALTRFGEDRAIRIMTIHKSKGLEFDSVIMLGVEREAYWADPAEELCLFFVGISRAKRRLILSHADFRERPSNWNKRWDEERTRHEEFLGYAEPSTS